MMQLSSDTTLLARIAVFDWYAELCDSDTPDLSDEMVSRLTSEAAKVARRTPPRNMDVRRWITDPAKYTPFIDEVAMERAMRFEWPIIDQLSDAEWWELWRRLGMKPDPTGAGADPELKRVSDKGVVERPFTELNEAWMRGTRRERGRITTGIARVA